MAKEVLSIGGSTDGGTTRKNECYWFAVSTDLWSAATSLGVTKFNGASYSIASGEALYSGGFATAVLTVVERNVAAADVWSARTSIPAARSAHNGASRLADDKAIMLGGLAGAKTNDSIVHSIAADTYTAGPAPGTAGRDMGCSGSLADAYIYHNSFVSTDSLTVRYDIGAAAFTSRAASGTNHTLSNGGFRTTGFIHIAGGSGGSGLINERHGEAGDTWTTRTGLVLSQTFNAAAGFGDVDGGIIWGKLTDNTSTLVQDGANTTSVGPTYATDINYAAGCQLVDDQPTPDYLVQIQFDDGGFGNVTTQSGDAGSGTKAGSGNVAYWTSTHTDKDDTDGTMDVRITADLE